jgi:phosphonate transport system substrate-binding protein
VTAGVTRRRAVGALVAVLALAGAACGAPGGPSGGGGGPSQEARAFTIGAIPDQDPEKLQRLYGTLAGYLSERLGVKVEYVPVTDYTAAVNLFRSGDLGMVWFGGLTGVQARLQAKGSRAILQRDIDERFHSVFIVNSSTGIDAVGSVAGLSRLAGLRFTFGSESSTSGRLMPEYFLDQAGVRPNDFAGQPGFSGSHDRTIALVESGTFEAGALNEQVWTSRTESGQVDRSKVKEVFTTPPYHDYHWVIRPDAAARYGGDFVDRVVRAFTELDAGDARGREILELFAAQRFIPTQDGNYRQIEEIARKAGLIL